MEGEKEEKGGKRDGKRQKGKELEESGLESEHGSQIKTFHRHGLNRYRALGSRTSHLQFADGAREAPGSFLYGPALSGWTKGSLGACPTEDV